MNTHTLPMSNEHPAGNGITIGPATSAPLRHA